MGTPCLRIGALLLVLLAAKPAGAGVRESLDRYKTGDAIIDVECFEPTSKGKHPLILLLHGSGGLEQATGLIFQGIARRLAGRGFVALIPHYFESTDHNVGEPFKEGEIGAWDRAVKDAINFAGDSGVVDTDRIGIFGFSLGSYLAYERAAHDPRVKALAWVSGITPIQPERTFPATLVLYGSKDRMTPPEKVRELQEAFKKQEIPCEVHVYPGAGHNLDVSRFADAGRRASKFFEKHVKGPNAKKKP